MSMYSPDEFRESDPDRLRTWIDAWPFATLVTVLDGAPVVTHVPLILDAARGAHGTLVGHLARPNPQRSEEHTSELQSLMRTSYAVFCLKKKKTLWITDNNKIII